MSVFIWYLPTYYLGVFMEQFLEEIPSELIYQSLLTEWSTFLKEMFQAPAKCKKFMSR